MMMRVDKIAFSPSHDPIRSYLSGPDPVGPAPLQTGERRTNAVGSAHVVSPVSKINKFTLIFAITLSQPYALNKAFA
jgi:hypothetical protein